jgi:1-acyl-sn-glycerol-3-phosphate acyltransferase
MNTAAQAPGLYDGWRLEARDPAYLSGYARLLEYYYKHYFRVEAFGVEHLPRRGPALLVGNHSGGLIAPDAAMTLYLWIRERGPNLPAYALVDASMFDVKGVNVHLAKCGGLRAHPRMAREALARGSVVLLYPGGASDSYRPYSRRNEIEFDGNKAFIKLALEYRTPIVPIVTTAHNTLMVIDDGRELAQMLGLNEKGVERLPVTISMSGLNVGVNFEPPFPVPFKIAVGTPLEFTGLDPVAARDRAIVSRCFDIVHAEMQRLLRLLSV